MAGGPFRLDRGGLIDRGRPLEFRFGGRTLTGFAGDTLASALLANGVRTVARSFKLHRPRGVFSAGIEEPNALVQLHDGARLVPSARAPTELLTAGLVAHPQGGWPGVGFDVLRVLDLAAPLLAAGFYHKTFIWPGWRFYEPLVRRLAGLGRSPREPDPDRYDVRNAHCDLLVVGGGVAGLRAALEAARAGQRVVLIEQEPLLGGRVRWDGSSVDGVPATKWLSQTRRELAASADVTLMTQTLAVGCYDHKVVTAIERSGTGGAPRERYWILRPARIVLATGAIEQPLVFSNNDRPGVMLAGAARRYLACHAVAPGRRVVVATNNDSAYDTAAELHAAGVTPLVVLDSRERVPDTPLERMRRLGIAVRAGSMPIDTRGFGALSGVEFARIAADGGVAGGGAVLPEVHRLRCDSLLVSGGWNPALHLFAQAGGRLIYRDGALAPANEVRDIAIAGGTAGTVVAGAPDAGPDGPRISPHGNRTRQWVDLLHDVTVADLELAIRENFTSIEHVKRYTTAGMAADQGKTSSPVTIEVTARLRGREPAELGYTTLRPPFAPTTLGAIVGRGTGERFAPRRTSPLDAWHRSHAAIVEDFGEWQRPAVYRRSAIEARGAATRRECRTVRTAVGLFDASPLGKIEVHGPDAREFLDRFYVNNFATLQPGRVRYGLMLRETGVIFDDGTVTGLASDRLLVTTTSANAGNVAAWLEEWHQCEWPQLRAVVVPVTDQWATLTLAGPSARAVLARLRPECDLSNAAFPHLALRETRLLGAPARIARISFSGELSYEISVPADAAVTTWEALLQEGRGFDIEPYGLDAVLRLRTEKGYLHVGTDTDGTTVPDDVGWGRIAAAKTRDFIGRRSLALAENCRPDRLQLVGLTAPAPIPIGAHLKAAQSREVTDGWVTSSTTTIGDGRHVALAMLRAGRSQTGATVSVHDSGRVAMHASVVSPVFYDPAGERVNA